MLRPALLLVALLALLSGCSVYERVFHPYRLPTPAAPPEFKRQMKAKKLAAKRGSKADQKAKGDDPAAPPPENASPTDGADAGSRQPATSKSTVKYDKGGLMKKPKLLRRRVNKPAPQPFKPFQSIRNFFKYKLHGKHKSKAKPKAAPDAAPVPEPDPQQQP